MKKDIIVNKWESMLFLDDVNECDKLPLSMLLEFSLNKLKSTNTQNNKCDYGIETLFIPIIKKLYLVYDYINYKNVLKEYPIWYDKFAIEIIKCGDMVDKDQVVFSSFIEYFKTIENLSK